MNVIIDIGEKKPIENDLLVYKNGKWETTNHEAVFVEEQAKISELSSQVAKLSEQVDTFKEQLSQMAKIIKENVL